MAKKKKLQLPPKYNWVDLSDELYSDTLDKILHTNKNLYINGAGGVGKSVMIDLAYNLLKGNVMVLASTGIAAANLAEKHVPAVTIHRGLRIPPLAIFDSTTTIDKEVVSTLIKIDTIIIEEVSMVSASLFDHIVRIIRQAEKWRTKEIRLLLFGDILQFAPVIGSEPTILKYYQNKYEGNIYFFNSNEFARRKVETVNLERIYRQKSEDMQDNLMKIRLDIADDSTFDFFNSRVQDLTDFIKLHDNCLVITTTKKREQVLNEEYGIPDKNAQHRMFKAEVTGDFKRSELSIVEDETTIYVGQQVMCLCNDPDKKFQNGTLGKVKEIFEDSVVIVKSDGVQVAVGMNKWDQYAYGYNEENDTIETRVVGSLKQIGCKPAFAVTFHKAQGMTLDSIYLDLQSWWMPKSGMYVGLSRCKTLEGIGLSRPISQDDVSVEAEAIDFYIKSGE